MTSRYLGPLNALLAILVLSVAGMVPDASAATVTRPDRESAYPEEIANITHHPWQPAAGEDLEVTMTLATDAPAPDQVSLLYCRVEPEYTCALPLFMEPIDRAGEWSGTIAWNERFMRPETVHVGYNVTLRYSDEDAVDRVRRVAAPTGNHWVPETFPSDSDGVYFFVAFADAGLDQEALAPPLSVFTLMLMTLIFIVRRGGSKR